ncbi:DegT/DnrJ/EryC1/StrS family aminotransferase [Candidatus Sumerlaeota bacterium]|nr:DegT/DnrJ/EryC1/StrS family aminotransferase [Candidatus Sumerlaeota bacterium]
MKPIPFLDLQTLHASIAGELNDAMAKVLQHGQFILGPEVRLFEHQFANFVGSRAAIGCANGTAALHAALHVLGIGPGMEVVLPAHTFIATAEAVILTGARPVFAEVTEETMLLDPTKLRSAFSARTAAIIAVHLYGMPCDMDAIRAIAAERNLAIVEDAAQAHGATYHGNQAGTLGATASFSFFPGKNLGAFGDAGAVTTNDPTLARKLRLYVNHGREAKFEHLSIGNNYRLDTLQAAVLSAKLRHLDEWNNQRQRLAARYIEHFAQEPFSSFPVQVQVAPTGAASSYHLMVVRTPHRNEVMEELRKRGVPTGLHYPIPCHLQPALAEFGGGPGSLVVTEKLAQQVLSLPMCPTLTVDDVDRICDIFRAVIIHMKLR